MNIDTKDTVLIRLDSGKSAIVVGRDNRIIVYPDDLLMVNDVKYKLEDAVTVITRSDRTIKQFLKLFLFGSDSFKRSYGLY